MTDPRYTPQVPVEAYDGKNLPPHLAPPYQPPPPPLPPPVDPNQGYMQGPGIGVQPEEIPVEQPRMSDADLIASIYAAAKAPKPVAAPEQQFYMEPPPVVPLSVSDPNWQGSRHVAPPKVSNHTNSSRLMIGGALALLVLLVLGGVAIMHSPLVQKTKQHALVAPVVPSSGPSVSTAPVPPPPVISAAEKTSVCNEGKEKGDKLTVTSGELPPLLAGVEPGNVRNLSILFGCTNVTSDTTEHEAFFPAAGSQVQDARDMANLMDLNLYYRIDCAKFNEAFSSPSSANGASGSSSKGTADPGRSVANSCFVKKNGATDGPLFIVLGWDTTPAHKQKFGIEVYWLDS